MEGMAVWRMGRGPESEGDPREGEELRGSSRGGKVLVSFLTPSALTRARHSQQLVELRRCSAHLNPTCLIIGCRVSAIH